MAEKPEDLPEIPVILDVVTTRELLVRTKSLADDMLKVCYRLYTKTGLALADLRSKSWVQKNDVPYKDDLDFVASAMGKKGIYTLNLSYEWGCTTTAQNDRENGGVKLYRTMDWPIEGMADKVVVAKQAGPAGDFWNITYPGFVGMLQGMAPKRFSIAINQAPVPKRGAGYYGDWVLARNDMFGRKEMPATFLLRKVFEEAADYKQAVDMLAKTPICIPAIFTVAGVNDGEHCIIERMPGFDAIVHHGRNAVANHWLNSEWKGHPREYWSVDREQCAAATHKSWKGDFDWVKHPILNPHTRLAFEVNAKTGTMKVVGMEADRRVTKPLDLKV